MGTHKQFVKSFLILVCVSLILPAVMLGQRLSGTNFSGVVGAGARALGMGGAFIAIVDDATAASWNPAGLGQLENPELTLVSRFQAYRNVTPANSDFYYNTEGSKNVNANSYGIDFAAFTFPLRIGNFKIVPQISFQRAINYKLNSTTNSVSHVEEWEDPRNGHGMLFMGSFQEEQRFSGGLDTLTFSLGLNPLKRVHIGVSVNYWTNGYDGYTARNEWGEISDLYDDSKQMSNNLSTESISVKINGYNYNLGLLVEIFKGFKVGFVYKSSFGANLDYSYYMEKDSVRPDSEEEGPEEENTDPFLGSARLRWPQTWGVGLSFQPIDPLTVSIDFTSTQWSAGKINNFPIVEKEMGRIIMELGTVYFPSLVAVEDEFLQKNTEQLRLGLEYVLIGKKFLIPIRLGCFTDAQYYLDSSNEKINFFGITGGVGIKKGGLGVDLAVLLETGSYLRDNADYSTTKYTEMKAYMSTSFSF
ncbi:MAG: hypothetical protein GY757_61375 [bacterium]|nr:hypothetical protein [bacterium]